MTDQPKEVEQQDNVDSYFCPFCGQGVDSDRWFTSEQVDQIQGVAMPAALQFIDDQQSSVSKGLNSEHVNVKKTRHRNIPNEPDPLTDPDDMIIVVSPCRSWEPIKIPDETASPLHCMICGQAFAL